MADQSRGWLRVDEGTIPLIASFPHTGTAIPEDCLSKFSSRGLALYDTDWHLDKVFEPVLPPGTTIVRTDISRSVIDVNRPPDGQSLYPGHATTDLCPDTDFDGTPLYRTGEAPDLDEIERRRVLYHAPYAQALRAQIERLRGLCGRVVVLDCHSIRPRVSRLFPDTLPALNIGTNDGASCSSELQTRLEAVAARSPFSWVSNGRFKGGWITRHFSDPMRGVESVQLEVAMNAYLTAISDAEYGAPPFKEDNAGLLRHVLRAFLAELVGTQ